MHYESEKMVASIARFITEISCYVLNHKGLRYRNHDDYLSSFLNINSYQLKLIISYIVSAIPYEIYLEKNSHIKNDLQVKVIHQVITFLFSAKTNAKDFKYHLEGVRNKILFHFAYKVSTKN